MSKSVYRYLFIVLINLYSLMIFIISKSAYIYDNIFWLIFLIFGFTLINENEVDVYKYINKYKKLEVYIFRRLSKLTTNTIMNLILVFILPIILSYKEIDLIKIIFIYLNLFMLLVFVNLGIIIDEIFKHKYKLKIVLSLYIAISFMVYPILLEIDFIKFINIASSFYTLILNGEVGNLFSLIFHYLLLLCFAIIIVEKKWRNSLC